MDARDRRRLMNEGRDAFNRGAYFDAHELWESVWMALEGRERESVQGLIQVAVAFLKLEQAKPDVAARLLEKALAKLERGPGSVEGLDLLRLARDAREVLAGIGSSLRPPPRLHLVST